MKTVHVLTDRLSNKFQSPTGIQHTLYHDEMNRTEIYTATHTILHLKRQGMLSEKALSLPIFANPHAFFKRRTYAWEVMDDGKVAVAFVTLNSADDFKRRIGSKKAISNLNRSIRAMKKGKEIPKKNNFALYDQEAIHSLPQKVRMAIEFDLKFKKGKENV